MLTIGRAATIALTLFLASSTWAQQAKDDAGQESTKGAAAKLRDMVNEFQKLARSGDADKAAAYYRENRDQLPADRVISSLVRVCMTYADKEVAYEWMRECVASIAETSPESTAMSIAPRYFLQVGTRCEKELEAYGALVALRKQCATEGDALPSRVDDSFLQALAAGAPEDKQPGHALELTERRKQLVKALAEADAEQAGALGARLATIAPAEARAADKPDLLGEAAAALKKALDKHSDAPNLGFAYMQTMMSYANAMVRTDIAKADKLVAELEATVKDAPEYARYERSVASIRRRLGAAQKHADLIGAQAPAIENVDWANGDPLTAAGPDRQGRAGRLLGGLVRTLHRHLPALARVEGRVRTPRARNRGRHSLLRIRLGRSGGANQESRGPLAGRRAGGHGSLRRAP